MGAGDSSAGAREDTSLALLRSISESSDEAVVGLSLDGKVISWNAAASRTFGYPQAEALGQPASRLIPEELLEEHRQLFEKARRGERVERFETVRLARDGRRIRYSLTASPVRDAAGTVIAVSEAGRDIESEKHTEHALALLAAIVESSDDAVVSKDLDGVIRSWNAGAERIFGYRAAEVVGRNVTMIIPPELHDEERTILERISAGERIEHFDTTRVGKGGRRIAISLTVSPIRDAKGAIIGASKIARDITDRQRGEREVRNSRRRLAAEAASLVRLSEASVRLWESRSLAAGLDEILRTTMGLVGAHMGNLQLLNALRNTLTIVAHQGFDAAFLATFEHMPVSERQAACGRAIASGEPAILEDVLADPSYAAFHDIARASGYRAVVSVPLCAADGSTLGAISVHFPSPHRPSDAEMRRVQLYCRQASDFIQRIRLEHTLREREAAMRDADRRKDEFLALMAHELRNPLAPIRHALAAARHAGATREQQAQAYGIVERQVSHMSRLLDDLLDISRITLGNVSLRKETTALAAAVESSVEASLPQIEGKRHELTVNLPGHPVMLDADPVRLAQIFTNLLINAAKYTPRGGHIELSAVDDDGIVTVTISDDGVGIAPEMMPRLFTLFSQAQPALGRAEDGTGLGLTLVRALVGLHGGTVEARSPGIGRGSTFIVRLPAGRADTLSDQADGEEPATVPTVRVLVVDDNRDAADSCATMLELSGHVVKTAYNGTRALQLGESFLPDVVLLDIGLPDLNGYEVARRMRASGWGATAALIAVTGQGRDEDRERALEAGFTEHLTRPVTPEAVESLVRSVADAAAAPGT